MATPCTFQRRCAKVCRMEEPSNDEDRKSLRIVVDDKFQSDLDRAKEVTGIRNLSDLVRFAVRQVVLRGAA